MGLLFYLFIVFSVVVDSKRYLSSNHTIIFQVFGVCLFFFASLQQFRCHLILKNLRLKDHNRKAECYMVPKGGWYDLVSSPHYLAEILIYLSFLLVFNLRALTLFCAFLFVVTNLTW
jgi:3-oxo-5-alpha-steroid 4-dehydrogenase 3